MGFMSLEKRPPSFAWEKGEKLFEYCQHGFSSDPEYIKKYGKCKPGAIFADKKCDFGGGKASKVEEAVLYDGGSETYDLSGFLWDTPKMFSSTEMFKSRGLIEAIKTGYEEAAQAMRELDFHARSLFQSMSAANGPKIFHKN